MAPLAPVSTKTPSSKRKAAKIEQAAGALSPTATHVAENSGAEENAGNTAVESTGEEDNNEEGEEDDADTITARPAKRIMSHIIRDEDSNMREKSPPQQEKEDVRPDVSHLQEPTDLWSKARAALWQKTPLQI
ncbi:hypothetical protein PTTG_01635 [Puccinia triticina 1-1 BBBD Race 1]|uniref:Uncharacterized protein n=2 Tax=Puccinia triticina TaxID=208348 RepID=A0A180GRZ4_PUCT1|nr:uncharacterized protein PtA15_11A335 [Puccinia triticina]OAV95188.1 hypothetical protein PTTG_01635 [Puccinia triticina 1-1 BBBD Race 1]WAQ89645.1 hypothetical protein PtA15_11A335 [Puccinia triticina]